VSAQASAFAAGERTVSAGHLGWTPEVVTPKAGVTAGQPVAGVLDGGAGLAAPAALATADAAGRSGDTQLGAQLAWEVPVDTAAGAYSSTLTVSLFPTD
jgi:hypothetical protein